MAEEVGGRHMVLPIDKDINGQKKAGLHLRRPALHVIVLNMVLTHLLFLLKQYFLFVSILTNTFQIFHYGFFRDGFLCFLVVYWFSGNYLQTGNTVSTFSYFFRTTLKPGT